MPSPPPPKRGEGLLWTVLHARSLIVMDCVVQLLVDGFQHEQPDYWLNFGNPWEIERLTVSYPIKFYGHVSVNEEGGRQIFKWIPGESVSGSGC